MDGKVPRLKGKDLPVAAMAVVEAQLQSMPPTEAPPSGRFCTEGVITNVVPFSTVGMPFPAVARMAQVTTPMFEMVTDCTYLVDGGLAFHATDVAATPGNPPDQNASETEVRAPAMIGSPSAIFDRIV